MYRNLLFAAILAISTTALPARAQAPETAHAADATRVEAANAPVGHMPAANTPAAAGDAAHGTDGAHAPEGLLDFHPDRLIWTLLIFGTLLALLYPLAWKNVLTGLKGREERIRADLADAEAASARAKATLDQYNAQLADAESRIRGMMSKAQSDGEKLATTIRMQAQTEAEEAKSRAVKEIDSARIAAVREIYEQTANLATDIAEKIIGRNLNADDQKDLVARSLEQLKTSGRN